MKIPQPPNPDFHDHADLVVTAPPNDNTDGGATDCVCGHAKAEHGPLKQPEKAEATWQCLHCGCTRGNPAWVPSNT
jgi:hypothetical protein